MNKIQLSDHFTYGRLIRFAVPSVIMMIFTSIYGVVDGFFVSNFVGKGPFAAVNIIMPALMILGTIGFMFGTGGSALVAKTMGEGNRDRANHLFSLFVVVSFICGVVLAVLGIIFLRPIAMLLGENNETLLNNCVRYGRIVLITLPFFILQMEFHSFFVTAEKPKLGLFITIAAGVTNMVLDALFILVFKWGLEGAAIATAIGQAVGGIVPLIYFTRKNPSLLKLTRPKFDFRAIVKACTNGSSELVSNVSMSLVAILYNKQLLKYVGQDGVSAYGVLMYVNLVFMAAFIGYAIGTAPIIGYHYGAKNSTELKSIFKKSLRIIIIVSFSMLLLAELLAKPLSGVFVGYDDDLMALTLRGFRIYSFTFLFAGIAIYGSSFFTALNNGIVSAIISFLRTLVFQIAAVMLLPLIFDVDGIWLSIVVAELIAAIVTTIFLIAKRSKYHY